MKASKSAYRRARARKEAFVIEQGEEGTPVAQICCKAGISQATDFNGKKK